jgi:hypothetical protein
VIADKILGFLGSALNKIPDGNIRAEVERDIRVAVAAGAREWGPLGVGSVLSVAALITYMLAVGFQHAKVDPVVIAVLLGLVGAFYRISFKGVMETAKKLDDVLEDREKRERG